MNACDALNDTLWLLYCDLNVCSVMLMYDLIFCLTALVSVVTVAL